MLSLYVSDNHRTWNTVLPFVTFAYDHSPHDTASYAPSYLLFGRDPVLAVDTVLHSEVVSSTVHTCDALARADVGEKLAVIV